MKKIIVSLTLLLISVACMANPFDPSKPVYVTITTSMGDVTVVLYDDTPLHKENFIKLCQDGTYNGVLFHRIIKDFVVQGGDPNSKAQEPGVCYGNYSGGYTVPAEIRPHYYNKRGVLIDAKQNDDVNVERASAGTQFCFIQGKVMTDEELDKAEARINSFRRNWLYYKFRKELTEKDSAIASNEEELHNQASMMADIAHDVMEPCVIPQERREVYKTIGGAPHLDGFLTIFGEVVEGLDVVEKMSRVATNSMDCPIDKVEIISTKVFQK